MARIKGQIIDELRSMDWVPRSVRARARHIERAIGELEARARPRADRRGDREEARHHRGRARGEPRRDRPLLDRRARRALDRLRLRRRPGGADRHDRGRGRSRPAGHALGDRAEGGARRSDPAPARAREARRHALLLRGADPARDRRGARSDRVARLAAPHEGDPPAQGAHRRRPAAPLPRSSNPPSPAGIRCGSNRPRRTSPVWLPPSPRRSATSPSPDTAVSGRRHLVEALLFEAEKTNRLGSIEQGTTVSDWDEHEQRRGMSLSGSLCHLEWKDRKINLVDTPGDAGFQADTFAALRVVEGVVVVLSGVMGVEVNTSRIWQRAEEQELSRVALREHARPRARRLLPRARGGAAAALRPLRRDPASDRQRARADGNRRPSPHVRVHGSLGRARGRAAADPRLDGRPRAGASREAARRRGRDRRGAHGALSRGGGARSAGGRRRAQVRR